MWKKSSGPVLNGSAPVLSRPNALSGEEVHAHSPRRPTGWMNTSNVDNGLAGASWNPQYNRHYHGEIGDARSMIPPSGPMSESGLSFPQVNLSAGHVGTNGFSFSDDPFTGSTKGNDFLRRSKRSTIEDTPMPDYLSSTTERTRARSDNSAMSYEPKDGKTTIDLTEEAVIVEMVKKLSPEKKVELLVQALSPTKPTGIHAPSNSPTSSTRQPTRHPLTAKPRMSSCAEVAAEVADQAVLLDPASPLNVDFQLEEEAIKPANIPIPPTPTDHRSASSSQAHSLRSRKRVIHDDEDKENEPKSRSGSVEVTQTTSTSYKIAISGNDRPVLLPSNINRPRSNSSGSKRKRSSSPTRDCAGVHSVSPTPHKRVSQEPQ